MYGNEKHKSKPPPSPRPIRTCLCISLAHWTPTTLRTLQYKEVYLVSPSPHPAVQDRSLQVDFFCIVLHANFSRLLFAVLSR